MAFSKKTAILFGMNPPVPQSSAQPTEIQVEYNSNTINLFSNHIQLVTLAEEFYLECCLINPNIRKPLPTRSDGSISHIPVVCDARIIITREHAKRLAKLILDQFA